ncbi:hypothetical protein CERSUDRAFT_83482 [Gelatoporia subvermispora B]|uniref:J domain-containing protein n=1 Tax=Ceriporiopsis subvermispora (strain B) TaxID=914234 RepID=M2PMV1_CERS8|nr:hypothetical protein CERSUDRAFT_83482 [Gelatoporia subvermispora B]
MNPYADQGSRPWEHPTQNYTWTLEQEIAEMVRQNEETVRWVRQQQERDAAKQRTAFSVDEDPKLRRLLEDLASGFRCEAERWRSLEEETRRAARHWKREAEKLVQEEMSRLRAAQQETQRRRMAYERRRAYEDSRERRHREKEQAKAKARCEEADRQAWQSYQDRWEAITSARQEPAELTFRTIPWPTFSPPRDAEDITPARIALFILSPTHSEGQTRKERIKNALRRWHPDRFGRLLARVKESDKEEVEKAVGCVARCLNSLLAREA